LVTPQKASGFLSTGQPSETGFRWGLRWLSLMMLALGLPVALLLWQAARSLRAAPGAGYH